jgi:hypothetical protein
MHKTACGSYIPQNYLLKSGFHPLLLNVEVLNHGTPSTRTHQPWYTTKQSYLNPAPKAYQRLHVS